MSLGGFRRFWRRGGDFVGVDMGWGNFVVPVKSVWMNESLGLAVRSGAGVCVGGVGGWSGCNRISCLCLFKALFRAIAMSLVAFARGASQRSAGSLIATWRARRPVWPLLDYDCSS